MLTWFWVCMFICVWICTPGDQGDVWVCTCRWKSEVNHSPSWFFFFFSFHFWQTLWTWSSHTQVDWTAHPRDSAITAVSPHPALRFQTHILRCCWWCLIWVLGEIKLRSSSTLPTEPCCGSCGWFCHHSAGVGPVSQLLCGGGSSCTQEAETGQPGLHGDRETLSEKQHSNNKRCPLHILSHSLTVLSQAGCGSPPCSPSFWGRSGEYYTLEASLS